MPLPDEAQDMATMRDGSTRTNASSWPARRQHSGRSPVPPAPRVHSGLSILAWQGRAVPAFISDATLLHSALRPDGGKDACEEKNAYKKRRMHSTRPIVI